jgi:hypothetical protein
MSRTSRTLRTVGFVAAITVGGAVLASTIGTLAAATAGACGLRPNIASCGSPGTPTTTTLGTSANPAYVGTDVMLYVQVTDPNYGSTPFGGVDLVDNGTIVAHASLVNGSASFTVSSLPVGQNGLTANFTDSTATYAGSQASLSEEIVRFRSWSLGQLSASRAPRWAVPTDPCSRS